MYLRKRWRKMLSAVSILNDREVSPKFDDSTNQSNIVLRKKHKSSQNSDAMIFPSVLSCSFEGWTLFSV